MSRGNDTQRPFPGLLTPEMLSAGQEFTDRDPQWAPSREALNPAAEGRALAQMTSIPLGEPPGDVDVRSVYDVRPIQSFDVNLPLLAATPLSLAVEGGVTSVAVMDAVPLGYVFVIRQLDHCFSGSIVPAAFRTDVKLTLLRNGADVVGNIGVPVGAESEGLFRTFVIYDDGEQFGARADVTSLFLFSGAFLNVNFYGNFIRKTGRPAPMEIGNPVRVPIKSCP